MLHKVPLSVEYCSVEPTGQLPNGAATTPPPNVQAVQVLWLLITTAGAAAVKTGHIGTQLTVAELVAVQPLPDVTVTV